MNLTRFINGIALLGLALVFGTWTLLNFSSKPVETAEGWSFSQAFDWGEILTDKQVFTARLHGRDAFGFTENSQGSAEWDSAQAKFLARLDQGSLFVATEAADFSAEILVPVARIRVNGGLALLRWDSVAQFLQVYSLQGPVQLDFTDGTGVLASIAVPSGTRLDVPASKVTSTLQKIRLTKLVKEFPVFSFTDQELSASEKGLWEQAQACYDVAALALANQFKFQGGAGPHLEGWSGSIWAFYQSFQSGLTFVPVAEQRLKESRTQEALQFAFVNYARGDVQAGNRWLEIWKSNSEDRTELQNLYSELFFVLPGDDFYPVKYAVSQLLYPHQSLNEKLGHEFSEIERLLGRSDTVHVQAAYAQYQEDFQLALKGGLFDESSTLAELLRQYGLLERLLRENAVFYSQGQMALLADLEARILSLSTTAQDLQEERQAIVQSKIRLLTNLFRFVEEDQLQTQEAMPLAQALLLEAQSQLEGISSQVAIRSYFSEQIQDFSLALDFMSSPEFASADSFESGLKAYRVKVASLAELNTYIQNVRAGLPTTEEAPLSSEVALEQAKDGLYTHGIQYRELLSLGDHANRLFSVVDARTAGTRFEAKYDLGTQILYDVVVGDLRFPTGLKLESASEVIAAALRSESDSGSGEAPVQEVALDSASLAESVALKLVQDQFEKAGLISEDFHFKILDLQNNLFSFTGVLTPARLDLRGEYDANSQVFSSLTWNFRGEWKPLPDLGLGAISEALYETYRALVN